LDGGTFLIPVQLTGCAVNDVDGFPSVTRVYPINLPLMAAIYPERDLLRVNGSMTLASPLVTTELNVNQSDWEEVVAKDETYQVDFQRLMKQITKGRDVYADRASYYLKKATDMQDLNLAPIKNFIAHTGQLLSSVMTGSTILGSISIFWIVAVSALVMAVYNMCRAHYR
jgi:hypothetical protein